MLHPFKLPFHVIIKYSVVSVITCVASPSAPVVSSSGAFSAATASVVSQSASAAVVTSLGAASVVTQSASSSPFRRVYSIP